MAPMLAKHKVAELSPFRWLLLWPALSWPVVTLVHHWTDNAKKHTHSATVKSVRRRFLNRRGELSTKKNNRG